MERPAPSSSSKRGSLRLSTTTIIGLPLLLYSSHSREIVHEVSATQSNGVRREALKATCKI